MDKIDTKTSLLVVLVVILFVVVCYQLTNTLLEGFEENFGSSCTNLIKFESTPKYDLKPDTIFISIASYRDAECSTTLNTIYSKAAKPQNVFCGICEQNKEGESNEICYKPGTVTIETDTLETNLSIESKVLISIEGENEKIPFEDWVKSNIRYHNFSYLDAAGPTYARYYCSKLWRGENYYFQIDSHTTFEKNWDINLIKMINQCKYAPEVSEEHPYGKEGSKRPILSCYPPTEEQMKISGLPIMSGGKIYNVNGLPIFLAGFQIYPEDKFPKYPLRSPKPFIAAGYFFTDASFLYDIPYDPNLGHLFQGEETLVSCRLFTHGYDIFTPNVKVCFHHYNRQGPMYFKDIKNTNFCREKAETRVKFLLKLADKKSLVDDYVRDLDHYGLGTFRTLSDFWNASGIKVKNGKLESLEDWGENSTVSKEFEDWNFNKSNYEKIRQFL